MHAQEELVRLVSVSTVQEIQHTAIIWVTIPYKVTGSKIFSITVS